MLPPGKQYYELFMLCLDSFDTFTCDPQPPCTWIHNSAGRMHPFQIDKTLSLDIESICESALLKRHHFSYWFTNYVPVNFGLKCTYWITTVSCEIWGSHGWNWRLLGSGMWRRVVLPTYSKNTVFSFQDILIVFHFGYCSYRIHLMICLEFLQWLAEYCGFIELLCNYIL